MARSRTEQAERRRAEPDDSTPASTRPTCTATGLPAGLSISADGVISGLITETGTNTVTIRTTAAGTAPHDVTFVWIVM